MDIEKLMTDYIAYQWKLIDEKENPQLVADKLASIKAQLAAVGIETDAVFTHDRCGSFVVGLKTEPAAERTYYCVHCHQKGDIDVRYDHDFSAYATFVGDVER